MIERAMIEHDFAALCGIGKSLSTIVTVFAAALAAHTRHVTMCCLLTCEQCSTSEVVRKRSTGERGVQSFPKQPVSTAVYPVVVGAVHMHAGDWSAMASEWRFQLLDMFLQT